MSEQNTKEDILEKAYNLGFEYEKTYRGCSQCSVAALHDILGIRDDAIFKAATGFTGGGGLTGVGVCGGYAGGVMVISQLLGRERSAFDDPDRKRLKNFELVREFTTGFIEELGSVICRDIQMRAFGRPFYIADPDEFEKFENAGGHRDKCTDVVGKATRLALKFILEKDLASVPS